MINNGPGVIPEFRVPKDSEVLVEMLERALPPQIIREILDELTARNDRVAVTAVVKWINSSNPELRLAALRYFSRVRAPEAVLPISQRLVDVDPNVREQASSAMLTQGESAVAALGKFLKHEDPTIRELAISLLGQIATGESESLLMQALDDRTVVKVIGDYPILARADAIRALASQRSSKATPRVIDALSDPDRSVQLAAIEASQTLGLKDAIPRLIAMLDSPDGRVSAKAYRALIGLTGQDHGRKSEEWRVMLKKPQ